MARMKIPTNHYYNAGVSFGDGPCVVCGRNVVDAKYVVHMTDGGDNACTPDEDAHVNQHEGSSDLGIQPIGGHANNGCVRWLRLNHPEFYADYVRKA